MSEQACCAHCKVEAKHEDYPDGHRSEYWECASGCGQRFYPAQTDQAGIRLRDWFAGMAMSALIRDGIVNASIPALSKATGRDSEWRAELITAASKSAFDIADAMLAERNKKV